MTKLSKSSKDLQRQIIAEYRIEDPDGLAILETAMVARDLMTSAQRVVDIEGLTVKGDRGQVKAHPLLACIRDQRAQFLAGLKALHLEIAER